MKRKSPLAREKVRPPKQTDVTVALLAYSSSRFFFFSCSVSDTVATYVSLYLSISYGTLAERLTRWWRRTGVCWT